MSRISGTFGKNQPSENSSFGVGIVGPWGFNSSCMSPCWCWNWGCLSGGGLSWTRVCRDLLLLDRVLGSILGSILNVGVVNMEATRTWAFFGRLGTIAKIRSNTGHPLQSTMSLTGANPGILFILLCNNPRSLSFTQCSVSTTSKGF